jgi:hypothetical protein
MKRDALQCTAWLTMVLFQPWSIPAMSFCLPLITIHLLGFCWDCTQTQLASPCGCHPQTPVAAPPTPQVPASPVTCATRRLPQTVMMLPGPPAWSVASAAGSSPWHQPASTAARSSPRQPPSPRGATRGTGRGDRAAGIPRRWIGGMRRSTATARPRRRVQRPAGWGLNLGVAPPVAAAALRGGGVCAALVWSFQRTGD